MALQILKLPVNFISLCLNSNPSLSFLSHCSSRKISVRWVKAQIRSPLRSYAVIKSGKIQLPKKKRRLDEICLERFQQYSRTFIQSWILQGKVFVDGKVVNKAGTPVSEKAVVQIMAEVPKYVAEKIRRHERVCVIERTNLRYLSGLPQKVDLVTLDLSFISILLVMPAVVSVMKEDASLVTLVKPQFEARRSQVGSGGIVRDPTVHQEVLEKIITGVENFGFCSKGWIESPLKGAEGNTEFLVHFSRTAERNAN
ncbi:uncharacterized protein LOC121239305 isoform X2 [Juglans microcarpa x Juglans regia]|uniref:uncharacterized protein LOC121239305 isoform X2 n=1 Tax=Juglans microcarpa x Juglans regia TaxID=2249226 RepID=UPI001B7F2149|nr:uncharacterized protein LOC121239305 isoform X2 [Juglans microcarpa x Juglans regia]